MKVIWAKDGGSWTPWGPTIIFFTHWNHVITIKWQLDVCQGGGVDVVKIGEIKVSVQELGLKKVFFLTEIWIISLQSGLFWKCSGFYCYNFLNKSYGCLKSTESEIFLFDPTLSSNNSSLKNDSIKKTSHFQERQDLSFQMAYPGDLRKIFQSVLFQYGQDFNAGWRSPSLPPINPLVGSLVPCGPTY